MVAIACRLCISKVISWLGFYHSSNSKPCYVWRSAKMSVMTLPFLKSNEYSTSYWFYRIALHMETTGFASGVRRLSGHNKNKAVKEKQYEYWIHNAYEMKMLQALDTSRLLNSVIVLLF